MRVFDFLPEYKNLYVDLKSLQRDNLTISELEVFGCHYDHLIRCIAMSDENCPIQLKQSIKSMNFIMS